MGPFVTLDDSSHFTGYEPNAMELTNATELNDSVFSKFTDFQDSLAHFAPSSDHDVDDETLGKLLAEVHRDYADYRRPEGVSVSQSSMSVMVDRTGKPVERSEVDKNSVHKEFLEIVGNGKPTGNVWKETIAVSATIWISVEKVHH